MKSNNIHSIYPISWICESPIFRDYVSSKINSSDEFLVADFASGEHDRVPSFFINNLSEFVSITKTQSERIHVYCLDIHALRLDSLLGKLEESDLLQKARVVKAKLESMDKHASFRPAMAEFLKDNPNYSIWLDDFLIAEQKLPSGCFDIGILNNDIIGYMMEYYTEYSNAIRGLKKVQSSIKNDGLLIVTNPCSLYVIDNVELLQKIGFNFSEGIDIDTNSGLLTSIEADQDPKTMSRLGHYTFLIFKVAK